MLGPPTMIPPPLPIMAPPPLMMDTAATNNNNPMINPWVMQLENSANNVTTGNGISAENMAIWRERERRQRTIRVLMMFLLMLLLMDGDENNYNNNNTNGANINQGGGLRNGNRLRARGGRNGKKSLFSNNVVIPKPLEPEVFKARIQQDETIRSLVEQHGRYKSLLETNGGTNVEADVLKWAQQHADEEKDEFVFGVGVGAGAASAVVVGPSAAVSGAATSKMSSSTPGDNSKEEEQRRVFHYPWNSTGFYRGEWTLLQQIQSSSSLENEAAAASSSSYELKQQQQQSRSSSSGSSSISQKKKPLLLDAVALEPIVEDMILQRQQQQRNKNKKENKDNALVVDDDNDVGNTMMGVFVLPPNVSIKTRDDHNLTSLRWERMTVDTSGRTFQPTATTDEDTTTLTTAGAADAADSINNNANPTPTQQQQPEKAQKITLTRDNGRAAFQIFSRSVPGMKELSLVDGFVKLYDSTSPGYSTRKDILLRVRGVLIHSIGRLSLVSSNVHVGRTALVLGTATTSNEQAKKDRRRRLLSTLESMEQQQQSDGSAASESLLESSIEQIRKDVLALYSSDLLEHEQQLPPITSSIQSSEEKEEEEEWGISSVASESQPLDDEEEDVEVRQTTKEDRLLLGGQVPIADTDTATTPISSSSRSIQVVEDEGATGMMNADASTATTSTSSTEGQHEEKTTTYTSSSASSVSRKIAEIRDEPSSSSTATSSNAHNQNQQQILPPWSDIVIPYPYIRDNADESIRQVRTPAYRRMPPREQLLEANAASCEFEIQMDILPVEWTVGAWRNLLTRRLLEQKKLDPSNNAASSNGGIGGDLSSSSTLSSPSVVVEPATTPSLRSRAARARALQDQALVITMVGTIHSSNCGFSAALNATALRTDWEATTSKAINYSFNMMLVCLAQILVLLRQLLHSQSQSAAIRVSLLCIGWQTVLDALICLAHIYFSLAMQPLFTAFASVAFFKLLIFCVIEMKYMAMIIQARNSSNGGQTSEVLRRQVTMLHLRFYVALFGTFLLAFYVGETYRIVYALALYSFWVPQIIYNVYTEAKNPLHTYYIYGMSLTRLVSPLYIFAVPNNFLKEVYPEAPTDPLLFELLVLWVGIQTAVLIGQSKYGARFMIPARFLPPKFDYSRPLPPSMLPPDWDSSSSSSSSSSGPISESMDDTCRNFNKNSNNGTTCSSNSRTSSSSALMDTQSRLDRNQLSESPGRHHPTAVTTRNRLRGKRDRMTESKATATTTKVEEVVRIPPASSSQPEQHEHHTLDCSICYDSIDVRNRRGYMLAPCDHLFHRDCLVQWMDVKMECPICRTELPAL